ncbi:MAG: hypothetical protein AB7H71_14230 [Alphaproteobacteria bacterium]
MSAVGHSASYGFFHKWDEGADHDGQDELQWGNGASPFDHDDLPLSALWGRDPKTWLDATSFAKGGKKPGGGGGGGTGGGGTGGGGGTTDPGIVGTYYAGAADGEAGYDIRIDFKGTGWTDGLKKAFTDTADYFTKVITADIGGGKYYNNVYDDDLYMVAELKTIDGAGGILGQSGPTAVWSNELTEAGLMQFDTADATNYLNNGLWDDIVTHEMMHVLGFGTLWNYGANPLVPTAGQYIGANGLAAYQAAGHPDAAYIPVEVYGGAGTAGAHWSESALGNELMTPYINGTNYLSSFSVMSLADLGYQVQPLPWPGNPVA